MTENVANCKESDLVILIVIIVFESKNNLGYNHTKSDQHSLSDMKPHLQSNKHDNFRQVCIIVYIFSVDFYQL